MSPVKQRHAELIFEQLDVAANGGGRDMQFLRGQLDAEEPTRGFESSQSVERRKRSHDEMLPRTYGGRFAELPVAAAARHRHAGRCRSRKAPT
jgi:hypothetical protein